METLKAVDFANAPDEQKLDDAFTLASETLPDKPQHIKKPWISEATYSLIKEKHHMEETGNAALRDKIKEVRKSSDSRSKRSEPWASKRV